MAATYRSSASATTINSAATVVINKPTGTVDNDIMIAVCSGSGSVSTAFTAPAGWSAVGSVKRGFDNGTATYVFSKLAASEGTNYTFTQTSVERSSCAIISVQGNDTTTPVAGNSSAGGGSFSASPQTVSAGAGVTIASAGGVLIYAGSANGNALFGSAPTWGVPGSPGTFTNIVDIIDADTKIPLMVSTLNWSGSGASGSVSTTLTDTITAEGIGFLIGINPLAAGGGTPNQPMFYQRKTLYFI